MYYKDATGRTALVHSCISEKEDLINGLALTGQCDPNIKDNDGNSPLMYAVKSRKASLVRSLLVAFKETEINVNQTNNKGI